MNNQQILIKFKTCNLNFSPTFEWEGVSKPPDCVDTIIFIESPKVLQVCSKTLNSQKPVAKILNAGVSIHKIDSNYLVSFNGTCKDFTTGEVIKLNGVQVKH